MPCCCWQWHGHLTYQKHDWTWWSWYFLFFTVFYIRTLRGFLFSPTSPLSFVSVTHLVLELCLKNRGELYTAHVLRSPLQDSYTYRFLRNVNLQSSIKDNVVVYIFLVTIYIPTSRCLLNSFFLFGNVRLAVVLAFSLNPLTMKVCNLDVGCIFSIHHNPFRFFSSFLVETITRICILLTQRLSMWSLLNEWTAGCADFSKPPSRLPWLFR